MWGGCWALPLMHVPPQGVPEDLLLFYNHLREGGGVFRVDRSLLLYRYHPNAATHSVLEYVKGMARHTGDSQHGWGSEHGAAQGQVSGQRLPEIMGEHWVRWACTES